MPANLILSFTPTPEMTIVIPSLDGSRNGNLEKLIYDLKKQTFKSIEIIVSTRESPNGRARNIGTALANPSAKYFAFFDDDVRLGHTRILANFVSSLQNKQIGLVGASQLPPENSTLLQKWIGYDVSKAKYPIQKMLTDTEMATHAGMACRKAVWSEMGGESDTLITGTDTDLRDRLRKSKYRVVVAPNTWVFHPLPNSVMHVIKSAIYNGIHQVDYRKIHEYQHGILKPFKEITTSFQVVIAIMREFIFFLPHIFVANRVPMIGFRPLNAIYRLLMVISYTITSYRTSTL
jgi:hypothetical protein